MSAEVKDFQKATAERILHIYRDMGRSRVLLSDEVGLGKTFVAKNVIDLVRKWHRDELHGDFFKVVYVCSNANIADQNIGKLGVSNYLGKTCVSESRLSMQHLFISIANKRIRDEIKADSEIPESIISLTPSTSFKFYSASGTANERALIFDIIKEMPELKPQEGYISTFLSGNVKQWEEYFCRHYADMIRDYCDDCYVADMIRKLRERLSQEFIDKLLDLTKENWVYKPKDKQNEDEKLKDKERTEVITKLRQTFAEISMDMLEPDLVVMDEFQRFSDLLKHGCDEQSMLVQKFFDTSRKNTKVLLLSATPYRPYTTLEELNMDGKDTHIKDFNDVMDFLFVSKDSSEHFNCVWQHYSAALKSTEVTDLSPLIEAKNGAERELYSVMCRTERFNTGIIDDSNVTDIEVLPGDILSYAQGQNMLEYLESKKPDLNVGNMPMEYIKASPYLLSFMDKYELKKRMRSGINGTDALANCNTDMLLLPKSRIKKYSMVDPCHGKLKFLHDIVFGKSHEKKAHMLLWVPASHPYYRAGGIFESKEAQRFSKILLFSAWEMVPRMVSAMMSYYAELYTVGEMRKENKKEYKDYSSKKRYGEERLKNSDVLEYPCRTLSEMYKPEEYYGKKLSEIRKIVRQKVEERLEGIKRQERIKKQEKSEEGGNANYILNIMKIFDGDSELESKGSYIPQNAAKVLTYIAIASPAVCAYRISKDENDAAKAAKAIVSIFNKAEAAAVIDLLYKKKKDDIYYISVLNYCAQGNLQAVLDEYAHMLEETTIGDGVAGAVIDTSILHVDTINGNEMEDMTMRCHFAVPFIDKSTTDKSVNHIKDIRNAFNSPFRPFVLSSTSVGQEGLDFHMYSRKIVHWNLPSNPVDLEQREGRINRFKCLAIRRNVAKLYGGEMYRSWDEMFDMAKKELKGSFSDMVPYWCLPVDKLTDEQRSKLEYIERIIPLYPFSRDRVKYKRLISVLSLYRMTLGQPRQEELLDLLKGMNLSDDQLRELTINLCPFDKA
jgi:hypothetical protein